MESQRCHQNTHEMDTAHLLQVPIIREYPRSVIVPVLGSFAFQAFTHPRETKAEDHPEESKM